MRLINVPFLFNYFYWLDAGSRYRSTAAGARARAAASVDAVTRGGSAQTCYVPAMSVTCMLVSLCVPNFYLGPVSISVTP